VIQKMRAVANATEDSRKKDIDSCWGIIDGMVGHESDQALPKNFFLMGRFAASDQRRVEMTAYMIANAKHTLQQRYLEFMDAHVRSTLPEATGSAGSVEGVHDFVYSRNIPRSSEAWACVYYAIRCGSLRVARTFAERELAPEDQPLVGLLDDVMRGYPPKSQAWCLQQYLHCRKSGGDVYKRAVMNILGCCEPLEDIHSEIAINIEDFLWVKLNLLRGADQMVEDFAHLQRLIFVMYGETYFQAG
jgi:hypothetical protein